MPSFEFRPGDLMWTVEFDWCIDEAYEEYLVARYKGNGQHETWYEIDIVSPTVTGNVPAVESELGPFISRTIHR